MCILWNLNHHLPTQNKTQVLRSEIRNTSKPHTTPPSSPILPNASASANAAETKTMSSPPPNPRDEEEDEDKVEEKEEEAEDSPTVKAAKNYLAAFLNKQLRIHTSDDRVFAGEFKCTDNVRFALGF